MRLTLEDRKDYPTVWQWAGARLLERGRVHGGHRARGRGGHRRAEASLEGETGGDKSQHCGESATRRSELVGEISFVSSKILFGVGVKDSTLLPLMFFSISRIQQTRPSKRVRAPLSPRGPLRYTPSDSITLFSGLGVVLPLVRIPISSKTWRP